jgi:6-phosphogluconolactonase
MVEGVSFVFSAINGPGLERIDDKMTKISDHQEWYVFAGAYGSEEEECIQVLRFNSGTGELGQMSGRKGIENASFLAYDAPRRLLFSVSETSGEGKVVAYAVEQGSGALVELNRQPTLGEHPCYVSIDPAGKWLYAVNYTSGSVCVYPIEADGSIGAITDQVIHKGSGPRAGRQEGPHAHSIVTEPTGRYQMVADLGTDQINLYQTGISGRLTEVGSIESEPGSGPRHIAFHPVLPLVYVLNELNATVGVFNFDPERLSSSLLQSLSTLPDDFTGDNLSADIHLHPSGRYLYASNRGPDSLAVYEVLEDGKLQLITHVSTGGRTPRNFAIVPDGRYLLAANQDSGTIVIFAIGENGIPVPTGKTYEMPSPVCLVVAPLV